MVERCGIKCTCDSEKWAQGYAPTIGVLSLNAKLPSLPTSQNYVLGLIVAVLSSCQVFYIIAQKIAGRDFSHDLPLILDSLVLSASSDFGLFFCVLLPAVPQKFML